MELPIVVEDNGDITAFKTVEAAQNAIEPIDARENTYRVYDRNGNLLRLGIKPSKQQYQFWFLSWSVATEKVYISESGSIENRTDELHEILISFLNSTGWQKDELIHETLEELIQKIPIRA